MATINHEATTDAPAPAALLPVKKRTFAAKHYPAGSQERAQLNLHTSTSEYMPSYRYYIEFPDGSTNTFHTKKEGEKWVDRLLNRKGA